MRNGCSIITKTFIESGRQMRLRYLDIAKGIGIILVVAGHFFPVGSPHWYEVLRQVIYSFHMPLFLLISGFVFVYSGQSGQPYLAVIKNKFRRIAVPYLVTSVVFVAIKFLLQCFSVYLKNPVTAASFLKIFWYPEAAVSFWYLWALWWFYLVVTLFRSKVSRLILLAFALVFAYIPLEMPDVFALPKVKEMFPYFMAGACAADWDRDQKVFRSVPGWVSCCVFVLLVVLWQCFGLRAGLLLALSGAASVISISSVVAYAVDRGGFQWLAKVAASSYMIYLVHPIFIAGVLAVMHKMALPLDNGFVFLALAFIACSTAIICPMILYRIIIKLKSNGR